MKPSEHRHRRRGSTLLPLMCLGIAACVTGPTIRSQSDPQADFTRYRTFGFYDEASGSEPAYSSFVAQYLKKAVAREMQARGISQAENPDLLVNFKLVTKDKVQVTPTTSGYYDYRRGYAWGGVMPYATDVSTYTEGTLSVDVISKSRMQLVWEATAVGRIKEKSLENPEPAINLVIAQVFEQFPRPAPAAPAGS